MRPSYRSTQFNREYKLMTRRGVRMEKLDAVMLDIINERPLSPLRRDHASTGELKGYRDCHIEGDWVLIYRIDSIPECDRKPSEPEESVTITRTGTHSDIFE